MCLKVIAKKKLFIIILFIIAFSLICGTVYLRADRTEVKSIKSAVVHFEYETTDVSQSLTKDETEILKKFLPIKNCTRTVLRVVSVKTFPLSLTVLKPFA